MTKDPFHAADADARELARHLLAEATHAALAVTEAETGHPAVSRVALAPGPGGAPLSLVSQLSPHTAALEANPECALLVAGPEDKGDPLTHPRLSLQCRARLVPRDSDDHAPLRAAFLAARPQAKLYIDFGDFRMVDFTIHDGLLNAGFGKAYKLSPDDLREDPS